MKTFKFIKFAFGVLAIGLMSILALNSTGGTTERDVQTEVFGTEKVSADVPGGGDGCDAGGDGDCA